MSAEATPEEEVSVTAVLWPAQHADFAVLPTNTKQLLSRAQFADGVAAALQMVFGSLGTVMLLQDPSLYTECAFMDHDLFFLAL